MSDKLKCKTCGDLGDCNGTIPECANCWEVERRLNLYLQTEKGRAFVAEALREAKAKAKEEPVPW